MSGKGDFGGGRGTLAQTSGHDMQAASGASLGICTGYLDRVGPWVVRRAAGGCLLGRV